ncbi:MAG: elongation factor P [Planctomycetota bacterium]|jgi:elongation factor P|nr:elongation factor P [Planctomycetota bacterium]
MINATEIRKGMVIRLDGELFVVLGREHVTPGNWRAMVQTEMRSLRSGNKTQKRFRSNDQVDEVYVETKSFEYLYPEADAYVFMDSENYDQIPVTRDVIGDDINFLPENSVVRGTLIEGKIVSIELPSSVILEIVDAEPGVKGDSRTNIFKTAKVSTGFTVKVPLFMKIGDRIKIDTRTGEFVERVN